MFNTSYVQEPSSFRFEFYILPKSRVNDDLISADVQFFFPLQYGIIMYISEERYIYVNGTMNKRYIVDYGMARNGPSIDKKYPTSFFISLGWKDNIVHVYKEEKIITSIYIASFIMNIITVVFGVITSFVSNCKKDVPDKSGYIEIKE